MREIGGYFELELSKGAESYHTSAYQFKSGRSSLNFILQSVKPKKVYVPFYTCDALLEPLMVNEIAYDFYAINERFEIKEPLVIQDGEMLIYINYYDLKRGYVNNLSEKYGQQLIIDCTQSYFLKGNGKSWFFNSTRKFFGVPDGSDMYAPLGYNVNEAYTSLEENTDYLFDHLLLRFNGNTQPGYDYFKRNEVMNDSELKKSSKLSKYLLSKVDFKNALNRRRSNFQILHDSLNDSNTLDIKLTENIVSNFYPYLPSTALHKKSFWGKSVFVPTLWPDCSSRITDGDFRFEKNLSDTLLPLPTDHRYDSSHMEKIIDILFNYSESSNS